MVSSWSWISSSPCYDTSEFMGVCPGNLYAICNMQKAYNHIFWGRGILSSQQCIRVDYSHVSSTVSSFTYCNVWFENILRISKVVHQEGDEGLIIPGWKQNLFLVNFRFCTYSETGGGYSTGYTEITAEKTVNPRAQLMPQINTGYGRLP